jgi:hypothetical protein
MLCDGYAGFEVAYLLQTKLEKSYRILKYELRSFDCYSIISNSETDICLSEHMVRK